VPPSYCYSATHASLLLAYLPRSVGHTVSGLSIPGTKLMDAGLAAPEGGLRGRLYGKRCGGGDGTPLWSCGWRRAGDRVSCSWRRFGENNSQIVFGRPGSGTVGGLRYHAWRKGFSGRKICKRIPSSPCIGSAAVALFIKQGKSLFQEVLGMWHPEGAVKCFPLVLKE
jgi:hypothetical protein